MIDADRPINRAHYRELAGSGKSPETSAVPHLTDKAAQFIKDHPVYASATAAVLALLLAHGRAGEPAKASEIDTLSRSQTRITAEDEPPADHSAEPFYIYMPVGLRNASGFAQPRPAPEISPTPPSSPTPEPSATPRPSETPPPTEPPTPTETAVPKEYASISEGTIVFAGDASRVGKPSFAQEEIKVEHDKLKVRLLSDGTPISFTWRDEDGNKQSVLIRDLQNAPNIEGMEIDDEAYEPIRTQIVEDGEPILWSHGNRFYEVSKKEEGGLEARSDDEAFEEGADAYPLVQANIDNPITIEEILSNDSTMEKLWNAYSGADSENSKTSDELDSDTDVVDFYGFRESDTSFFTISPTNLGGSVEMYRSFIPAGPDAQIASMALVIHTDNRVEGPSDWERVGLTAGLLVDLNSGKVTYTGAALENTSSRDRITRDLDMELSFADNEDIGIVIFRDKKSGKDRVRIEKRIDKEVVGAEEFDSQIQLDDIDTATTRYFTTSREEGNFPRVGFDPRSETIVRPGEDDLVAFTKNTDDSIEEQKEIEMALALSALGDLRDVVESNLVIGTQSRYESHIHASLVNAGIGIDISRQFRNGNHNAMPDDEFGGSMLGEHLRRKGIVNMDGVDLNDLKWRMTISEADVEKQVNRVMGMNAYNPDNAVRLALTDKNGNVIAIQGQKAEETKNYLARTVGSIEDGMYEIHADATAAHFTSGSDIGAALNNTFLNLLDLQSRGAKITILRTDAAVTAAQRDEILRLAREAGLTNVERVLSFEVGAEHLDNGLGRNGEVQGVIELASPFDRMPHAEGRKTAIQTVDQAQNTSIPIASDELLSYTSNLRRALR